MGRRNINKLLMDVFINNMKEISETLRMKPTYDGND